MRRRSLELRRCAVLSQLYMKSQLFERRLEKVQLHRQGLDPTPHVTVLGKPTDGHPHHDHQPQHVADRETEHGRVDWKCTGLRSAARLPTWKRLLNGPGDTTSNSKGE